MIKFIDAFDRYNWIDNRNNFVGYYSDQICCEDFGYFWLNSEFELIKQEIIESDFYLWFDLTWNDEMYKEIQDKIKNIIDNKKEHNDIKIFRTTKSDEIKSDKYYYLVLFNHHNGYYAHQWKVSTFKEVGKL